MAELSTILQLILFITLVSSSVLKIADAQGFQEALLRSGYSNEASGVVKWAVPASEMGVACLLLGSPQLASLGAIAALVLLIIFTWHLLSAKRKGLGCNCFGTATAGTVGRAAVLRNLVLLAMAAFLAISSVVGPQSSQGAATHIAASYADLSSSAQTMLAITWVVFGMTIILAYGVAKGSSGATHAGGAPHAVSGSVEVKEPWRDSTLQIGSDLPSLTLQTDDGATTTLAQAVKERGRAAIVIFTDPGCSACRSVEELIIGWQVAEPPIPILPISRRDDSDGMGSDGSKKLSGVGVYYQTGFEVSSTMGVHATPSAVGVQIDAEGKVVIATETVVSAARVQQLVEDADWKEKSSQGPVSQSIRISREWSGDRSVVAQT